jgi:hypothetical protein
MKKIPFLTLLKLLTWSLGLGLAAAMLRAQPAAAALQAEQSQSTPTASGSPVVCLPGVYLQDPEDCQVVGPSAYLTGMAKLGITFPMQPLAASPADPTLSYSPYLYARLREYDAIPLYETVEDALNEVNPVKYIEAGELRYVSYTQEFIIRKDRTKPDVFLLKTGEYVAARDIARRENAVIRYQGLTFQATPKRAFGWILPINAGTRTKQTPGYEKADYNTHELIEYQVVQIYSTQAIDGTDWYLVGPDEWIEQRFIGKVTPNPSPPEGVTNGRWIEVNLFEQTLAVYDESRLVFATLIATGQEPFYTRPGLFPIYKKLESTPMRGAFEADRSDFYYLEDVPWTMYYDQARALHGAYWRTRFGIAQSHGCVNLSPGDAHWLFNWAQEGDWVYVWDPSGKTPTDPAAYGEGGA